MRAMKLLFRLETRQYLPRVHPRLDHLEGDAAADGLVLLDHPRLAHAALADALEMGSVEGVIRLDLATARPTSFGPARSERRRASPRIRRVERAAPQVSGDTPGPRPGGRPPAASDRRVPGPTAVRPRYACPAPGAPRQKAAGVVRRPRVRIVGVQEGEGLAQHPLGLGVHSALESAFAEAGQGVPQRGATRARRPPPLDEADEQFVGPLPPPRLQVGGGEGPRTSEACGRRRGRSALAPTSTRPPGAGRHRPAGRRRSRRWRGCPSRGRWSRCRPRPAPGTLAALPRTFGRRRPAGRRTGRTRPAPPSR